MGLEHHIRAVHEVIHQPAAIGMGPEHRIGEGVPELWVVAADPHPPPMDPVDCVGIALDYFPAPGADLVLALIVGRPHPGAHGSRTPSADSMCSSI